VTEHGSSRPNVLVLMLDQMRWDAVAAHGNRVIATPAMDELCRRGTTFSQAHTPSPVCVPARAGMLTGLLPHRSGVFSNETPLPEGAPTFVRALAESGYDTCAIGKMHFTPVRARHGFDRMLLSEEIPENPDEDEYLRDLIDNGFGYVEEPHGVRHELYYSPQPSQLPEEQHTTAWTGRRTIGFLEQHASSSDRPFLCFTSFIKPHPPFDPPSPWHRMYDPLDMPDPVRDEAELDRLSHQQRLQHRGKWIPGDADLLRIRTMRAYYYACVSFVDAWIGRILRTLDRLGLADRTMVLLTSDHGEYLGDHWSFGKRGFHEPASRVPLIVAGPGVVPGSTSDGLVMLPDIAATMYDLAGAAPSNLDGRSLAGVLAGDRAQHHAWLPGQLGHGPEGLYMAMDLDWKYIYSAADDREWLFDRRDEAEVRDESGNAEHGQVLRRLRGELVSRFIRDDYLEPLDGDDWRRYPDRPQLPPLGDRDPRGRGRQYATWTRDRQHPAELAREYVPQAPPFSPDPYSGR
jgi:arylsulfatase